MNIWLIFGLSVTLVVGVLVWALLRALRRAAVAEAKCSEQELSLGAQDVALARQRGLDAAKDEFVSTVSHELRTPLTSIRAALGLLGTGTVGSLDPKAQSLLRIATTNTDRLVRLINDILDLERMDAGSTPLHEEVCDFADLLRQSLDTMLPQAEEAGVRLELIDGGVQTVKMPCDADRILQLLCNLLSNAVKFSPVGAVVRMELELQPGEVDLRVVDEGRGIPEEQLEHVFERFRQVDAGDGRRKGGTGLGLAICKGIVEQHGGRLWAERNDARRPGATGATFAVRLPRSLKDFDQAVVVDGTR